MSSISCGRLPSHWRRLPCRCATLALGLQLVAAAPAFAAGTPVGTVIENIAQVEYDVGGSRVTVDSNTSDLTVIERIDVGVTAQTSQVLVSAGESDRGLLFTVTNLGNGPEAFTFAADSNLPGDDFDPVLAVPPIYFDTDGSGDLTPADVAWDPGVNDPLLAADETISMLLVNSIPGGVVNGNRGLSELTVLSATGTGSPGDTIVGAGEGGLDALLGASGGTASVTAEYLVADVSLDVIKSVVVSDPFGGTEAVPGATLAYTVTVEVTSAGTADNSVFADAIPAFTSYVPGSITLNGATLTDAADGDAGEYDGGSNSVVVRLGDLTIASGLQTVVFEVTVD